MKKSIYISILILVLFLVIILIMKKEIILSCDMKENTTDELSSSTITCDFINLPFNYIYANTEFYYQNKKHTSQGKLLKPEEFESNLSYYTIKFEPVLTEDKRIKIEFYVSENFFTQKKDEISLKIKQIDLNSGVEKSMVYKGKTSLMDN